MTLHRLALRSRAAWYTDHLQPVWDALPDEIKWEGAWRQHGEPVLLIAGAGDKVNGRPYVYLEHGSGQSYVDASSQAYSGGPGHQGARLFICPNEEVADRWRAAYPNTPAVAVGCPKLDRYHLGPPPPERTVAITFHWDCHISQESRTAFWHYEAQMYEIVRSWRRQGWKVFGHAHPRWREATLKPLWRKLQVPWTDDPLAEAAVLAADNTSMIAEFLSCGRPVVAFNHPGYRTDVQHGHRFWELDDVLHHVWEPEQAIELQLDTLTPPHRHTYAYNDGTAATRAAAAICEFLAGGVSPRPA